MAAPYGGGNRNQTQSDLRAETEMIGRLLKEGIDLMPTDANIHDILRNCVATVSFNSAVALEGFFYNKPAILFGQSDFHHVCETVQEPDQFGAAQERALRSNHDYARFLYWYFTTFCISLNSADLDSKILNTFAAEGFDADRLGMKALSSVIAPSTSNSAEATRQLGAHFGAHRRQIQRLTPVSVKPMQWHFTATLDGQNVTIKRFFGEMANTEVTSIKHEIAQLRTQFGTGDCQCPTVDAISSTDQIIVLCHPSGERLDQKITKSYGPARAALFTQAGRWLTVATAVRKRETTFAPLFWIKKLAQLKTEHLGKDNADLLAALLSKLRNDVKTLRGCAVTQAASHGDYIGRNLVHDGTTLASIDVTSEAWMPLARAVARFLVLQQSYDPAQENECIFGINADDLAAFLQSGVLPEEEFETTLQFFIGEQMYVQLVSSSEEPDVQDRVKVAAHTYLGNSREQRV